jgi:hypothetical protein
VRIVSGYISRRIIETSKRVRSSSHGTNADFEFDSEKHIVNCDVALPDTHTVHRQSPPFVKFRCLDTIFSFRAPVAQHSIGNYHIVISLASIYRTPTTTGNQSVFQAPTITIACRFARSPPSSLSQSNTRCTSALTHALHTRARFREYDTSIILRR